MAVLERHWEQTGQQPPALARRPELSPHLLGVWTDFHRLSRSRPSGMTGPAPLPFELLDRYAARFGPHGEAEFERWVEMITAMDEQVLARHAARAAAKGQGLPPGR